MSSNYFRIISLSICTLLLSACNSTTLNVVQTAPPEFISDTTNTDTVELPPSIYDPQETPEHTQEFMASYELAQSLFENGDYQQVIDRLELNTLNAASTIQFEAHILAALAAAYLDNTKLSFYYLQKADSLPAGRHPHNQNTLKEVQASIQEHFGNWLAAVNTRLNLSYDLPLNEGEENQNKLWLAVQNLTQSEVEILYELKEPILHGWLAVSSILKDQSLSIDQQLNTFELWQDENPNHPASVMPPKEFQIMASLDELAPKTIVLMLPMEGNLKRASQAIIDGFFSSFYLQQEAKPQVFIVNVDQYDNIQQALDVANEKQPDGIVGPLRKSNVAQIQQKTLKYPVIALNQLDFQQQKTDNLYHFSLSAEDEIHELVVFAKQEGASRAAVLSTEDTWAIKQSDDFLKSADMETVTITSHQAYANTPRGRQVAVQKLLLIDESIKRKNLIEQWADTSVESITRAREDLDYVFYAGKLDDAKQIRPLLDFYFANDIPILATSTLNNSVPEKSINPNDIERILFTEIPALTPNSVISDELDAQTDSNILKRLQALGADSYLLANKHQLFTLFPSTKFSANTGVITIDEKGIFHKRPDIMTYQKGRLVYATSEKFFPQEKQDTK